MTNDSSTYEHSASEYHDITKIELMSKDRRYIGKLEFIGSKLMKDESLKVHNIMYELFRYIDKGWIEVE